jgi:GNAT superfamily N-acetyltransferase
MPTVARVLGPRHADFYSRHLHRGGVVLSAWRSDQLVGAVYVSWDPADERKIRWLLRGVPLLHHLHILEGRRRQRIGTELVRAAEALARERGHRRVAVGIDLENRAAVLLYRHLGFRGWRWGKVRTVRDLYHADGRLAGRRRDKCRVFVKDLRK